MMEEPNDEDPLRQRQACQNLARRFIFVILGFSQSSSLITYQINISLFDRNTYGMDLRQEVYSLRILLYIKTYHFTSHVPGYFLH